MKKFFRMVMALSLVGGAFAFTGCTDYEDDIKALDDRVSALESTVADLQSKIDAGAVITDVTETEDGVTVTLSNGDSFTLTNGAAGTPGSVVTIGENGNWYIDNVDTGKPSRGEEGAAGADADIVYYRPNMETGNWDKVTISAETGEETVEPTEESWKAAGVTAVWDEENGTLTFTNVEGSDEPIVISLSTGMVTSVELVLSYTSAQQDDEPVLTFSSVIEQENVFEEGIENYITFTKGAQQQTSASFIVRVSPANVVLTKDMISLVNSKGENLDNFLTVTNVEKYDGLLTRAATNSGLWEVSVALQSYDKDTFAAKQYKNGKAAEGLILYAVQVNNTKEGDADRYVTSTYDITLAYTPYKASKDLWFIVSNADNSRNVADINNRYDDSSLSLLTPGTGTKLAPEYTWTGSAAVTPVYPGQPGTVNTGDDADDDRSHLTVFPAVQGEEITIALTSTKKDSKVVDPSAIRAMYVTLDKEANAIESVPSEWNAWNSYKYTGLNTVVDGKEVTITINPGDGQTILNDYIGFRVYAVNYDGTLVDPDGKAFYVKVGDSAKDWGTVATTIVPDASRATVPSSEKSDPYTVSGLSKLSGTGLTATWTTTDQGRNGVPAFDVEFYAGGTTPVFTASYNAQGTTVPSTVEFNKVTSIRTKPASDIDEWYKLKDGQAYTGTLTITNSEDFVLATMNVTMTKELPSVPAGFSIKTNQLDANGVYNCYLVPDSWAVPADPKTNFGTMDMDDVFNWGTGVISQYEISFANALVDPNDDTKVIANVVKGNEDLEVANAFIDNETQHATVVSYNFGKISSEEKDAKGNVVDYKPTVDTFPTIFSCIYNDTYTWDWATIEEMAEEHGNDWAKKDSKGNYVNDVPSTDLVYGLDYSFETPAGVEFGFDQAIAGVSSRDGLYNAFLYEPYLKSLKFEGGHVISKGNGVVDEYFKVVGEQGDLSFEATKTSTETNPTAEVPSTLQLTYLDMYGHKIVIELDVTVVPR